MILFMYCLNNSVKTLLLLTVPVKIAFLQGDTVWFIEALVLRKKLKKS